MLRLAHVACVGTGLLNIGFALSAAQLQLDPAPRAASVLFVAGAVTMPLVCVLSAWRAGFRHLFFVPALSLVLAAASFLYRGGSDENRLHRHERHPRARRRSCCGWG